MMLANYLGSGGQSRGLNPLYQIGGPRPHRELIGTAKWNEKGALEETEA
jgi:hypothetical protein